jgi:hypothetical protein
MRRTPAQVGPVGEPRAPTTLLIPIPHTEFVRTLRLIAEKIVLFLSALLPLKDLSSAPAFHPVSHPYSKPGTRREARARERIIGHSTSPLYRTEGASNAFTSWSHGPETGAHSSHPHARALPALSPSVSRRSGRCCLCLWRTRGCLGGGTSANSKGGRGQGLYQSSKRQRCARLRYYQPLQQRRRQRPATTPTDIPVTARPPLRTFLSVAHDSLRE